MMLDVMNLSILAQLRADTQGDWGNILVIVAFAVISAISGIIKSRSEKNKAKKASPKRQDQQYTPAKQRMTLKERIEKYERLARERQQIRSEAQTPSRPVSIHDGTEQKRSVKPYQVSRPSPRQIPRPVETIAFDTLPASIDRLPEIPELGLADDVTVIKPTVKAAVSKTKSKKISSLAAPAVLLGTSSQLRAAIIHYEIFGKCNAMKAPADQMWAV